jgi:D-xylonolactonase
MPAPNRPGRLYRLDTDGTLTIVLEGIGCSNGMGFTPDGKRMYHTDTSARTITRFAYDRTTGSLSNGEVFITVPREPGEGGPDGMTVDADGNLWSARWGGGCLVKYSGETGAEIERVMIPRVTEVSSVSFGGADYEPDVRDHGERT